MMTEQELDDMRHAARIAIELDTKYGAGTGGEFKPGEVLQLLDYIEFLKENPVVPKDWQLVPKHCTIGMESAGSHVGPYVVEQYRAMLEAAPSYKKETIE